MRILIMMALHGIDDILPDIELLQDTHTDLDMCPFDLMINRLADIMQEASLLGDGHIGTEFGGNSSGEVRYFQGMEQDVLLIAIAIPQATKDIE